MGWCDWRRQPGIRIIFNCAFGLNLVSLLLLFISFVTPYWVISWPRVFSGFKRVGLWEACFAGMVIPRDVTQKAYHGCWWILAPEYYPIRDWLMPPWFVFTQVIVTFLLFAEIAMCIVMLVVWGKTMGQEAKERWPWGMVMASLAITVITALLKSIAAIIFGVAATTDISWMPRPELNYLSWSYGLFLVSCFMSIFATMAMVCVRNLAKEGYTATDQTDSRKRYPPPASSLFRPPSQSLGEAMPPESMVSNPPPRSDRPPSTGGYQTGYQQEGLYPQGGYGYPQQEKQAPIGGYGYQPQQGGYQPQQGGYQPQQGGYQPQQVGYQPQQVGFQTQDPYPQKKKMDTTL